MKNVVYIITNKFNGKSYIGQASCFKHRKSNHLYRLRKGNHHSDHFQRSYNKHGEEAFIFEIVDQVDDPEKLTECEQWWIDSFDFDWLYNNDPVAGSSVGRVVSEKTREAMRQAQLGKKHSKKTRKKMSNAHKGKTFSRKTREKLSLAHLGRTVSEESRQKMSESKAGEKHNFWGMPRPQETKDRISRSQSNKKKVAQIDPKTGKFIKIFRSIRNASHQTGINAANISSVCNKRSQYHKKNKKWYVRNYAGGFKWKFIPESNVLLATKD